MAETGTRGGTHEQHVKAGEQSHKNTPSSATKGAHSPTHGSEESSNRSQTTQGGTHEQHVNAGKQSHKNS
jgi:hypothetical protein